MVQVGLEKFSIDLCRPLATDQRHDHLLVLHQQAHVSEAHCWVQRWVLVALEIHQKKSSLYAVQVRFDFQLPDLQIR